MAILNSPIMHGARGRLDGATIRQRYGQTIIAARPRRRRQMSARQGLQSSYFRIAVDSLRYVPQYAQLAYKSEPERARSAYNVCVSNVVAAFRSAQMPTDTPPSFPSLVRALRSADALAAIGEPADVTITMEDGVFSVTSATVAEIVLYHTDGVFARAVTLTAEANVMKSVPIPDGSKCALCIVRVDGVPVTMPVSQCSFLLL